MTCKASTGKALGTRWIFTLSYTAFPMLDPCT